MARHVINLDLSNIEIVQQGLNTKLFINKEEIKGVTAITLEMAIGQMPTLTFTLFPGQTNVRTVGKVIAEEIEGGLDEVIESPSREQANKWNDIEVMGDA